MKKLVLPLVLVATGTSAQTYQYAEDFTNETLLWTVDFWDTNNIRDVTEGSGVEVTDTSLIFTIIGDEASPDRTTVYTAPFNTDPGTQDSVRAVIEPDTTSVFSENGAFSSNVRHHFYNRLNDGGFPERGDGSRREGDVRADVKINVDNSGGEARICMDVRNADGNLETYNVFENGSADCQYFALEPALGETYDIEMSVDREARTITARINDETIIVMIDESMDFMPASTQPIIETTAEGAGDISVMNLYGVGGDDFFDDYRINGAPPAPIFFDDIDERTLHGSGDLRPSVVNDELKMMVTSNDGATRQSRVNLRGESDYIEATMSLSSETSYEATSSDSNAMALVRLSGSQYDVLQDGGMDDTDVGLAWGRIEIRLLPDQTTEAVYCLVRFDSEDFSQITSLLSGGNECEPFETSTALDTDYLTSISTNRANKTVSFRINDETVVHNIQEENIFQEGFNRQYNAVRTRIEGATGTVVGYADNVRNSRDALTREEQRAALTGTGDSGSTSSGGGSLSPLLVLLLLAGFVPAGIRRFKR
jgi:hypothetical protein